MSEACRKLFFSFFCSAGSYAEGDLWGKHEVGDNGELVLFENFFLCGCSYVASLDRTPPTWCGKSADGARQKPKTSLPRRLAILPRLREPVKTKPPKKFFKGE